MTEDMKLLKQFQIASTIWICSNRCTSSVISPMKGCQGAACVDCSAEWGGVQNV